MRLLIRTFLSLLLSASMLCSNEASAQVVTLVCSGAMHNYVSEPMEFKVGPAAASLDVDAKTFKTPVGNFHVTRIDETSISFDQPTEKLKVFGSLDRTTGASNIFWRTPRKKPRCNPALHTKLKPTRS